MSRARAAAAAALIAAAGCGHPAPRAEAAPSQGTAPASPPAAAPSDEAAALFAARDPARAEALALIHRAPRIDGHVFDPAALLRAVRGLRPLGQQAALEVLAEYDEIARATPGRAGLDAQRIFLVIRLLCEPVDPALPLPSLAIGQPDVTLPAGFAGWPLFPLVVQDGAPFLVVSGYALAGKAESPRVHIAYCRDHGRLGAATAAQPRFAAAADALVASPAWREVMADHAGAAAMIRAQAERAAQR